MSTEQHSPSTDRSDASGRGEQAEAPSKIPAKGWKEVGRRTLAEVKRDRVPMMAAAVAFAGMLALFPAMIAAISIYGLVVDPEVAASHAADLAASLPDAAASLVGNQLESIASAGDSALSIALLVSVLGALWSASGGLSMLIDALNIAYDEEDERGFVKKRGLAILLTLGRSSSWRSA